MSNHALVRDLRTWRLLTGLSGALVVVGTQDGSTWFVRKGAQQPADSVRLRRQAEKQIYLADSDITGICVPPVLADGELDGRYYFEMPLVVGLDGPTYLRVASYREVERFGDRLCDFLLSVANTSALFDKNPDSSLFDAMFGRLVQIRSRCPVVDPDTCERLFVLLDRLRQLNGIPRTLCHGDMTLENLIVTPDGLIWGIDLLDAPFDHYWNDVAKLHQDFSGGWYARSHAAIPIAVLQYLSDRVLETAFALDDRYENVHPVLMAMTFARILPYVVQDEVATAYVGERVRYYAQRGEDLLP